MSLRRFRILPTSYSVYAVYSRTENDITRQKNKRKVLSTRVCYHQARNQQCIGYPFSPGHTDSPKTAIRAYQRFFFSCIKLLYGGLDFFIHLHFWCVHSTMAGSTLAMRSMAFKQLSTMSRSMSTSALRAKSLRPVSQSVSQSVSRVCRRSYADAAPTPSPAPQPKKRFRVLRWAWRLTWLSAIGLTGTVAYSIFELRSPPDQSPPDPSKKTLVILGRLQLQLSSSSDGSTNATVSQELAGALSPC